MAPVAAQPVALGTSLVVADSFFQYSIAFTFGGAGTDQFTQAIQIDADGDFVCCYSVYENSLEVGAALGTKIVNGGGTLTLTDGGSQRALSNVAVPVRSLFGDARNPFVWPIQHLFKARTSIQIAITGAGATMANGLLRLTFCGYKRPPGQA